MQPLVNALYDTSALFCIIKSPHQHTADGEMRKEIGVGIKFL
jgi:hypothetical protein